LPQPPKPWYYRSEYSFRRVQLFYIPHISENMWYLPLCACLILLNIF
jgi:hypothetical protein